MLIKCSCFEIPASDKMFLILKLLNICTHVLLFHVLFFSTEWTLTHFFAGLCHLVTQLVAGSLTQFTHAHPNTIKEVLLVLFIFDELNWWELFCYGVIVSLPECFDFVLGSRWMKLVRQCPIEWATWGVQAMPCWTDLFYAVAKSVLNGMESWNGIHGVLHIPDSFSSQTYTFSCDIHSTFIYVYMRWQFWEIVACWVKKPVVAKNHSSCTGRMYKKS